jgi:integrase/recombinase XerD
VLDALELIARYAQASKLTYYPAGETILAHSGIDEDWRELAYRSDGRGRERVVRMVYEIATFQARKILARYATAAGIPGPISPHRLRHFLFTWLKTQGIDDALIQPYSGHATRQSLEIYSRIALTDAQDAYNQAITSYPI